MKIYNNWKNFIEQEQQQPYMRELLDKLAAAYETEIIYPDFNNIYRAFELTDISDVKVVILGQDPYHGKNQAHGLAFSVLPPNKIPPSLANIFKELATDLNTTLPTTTDLTPWAKQGVLLLNTTLTVLANQANSHQTLGWETFTDNVLSYLNRNNSGVVFILWGAHAIKKKKYIDETKHLVLTAPHPSPLSAYRGFFGSKPFSKTNTYLTEQKKTPIDWMLSQ